MTRLGLEVFANHRGSDARVVEGIINAKHRSAILSLWKDIHDMAGR
ncbi:unnamed protein product [Periconia digitata]|uniref:Uncharacterized protein n=1 Tax=Periconia digitata TaxID=1303443 RepID=A0A9W4U2M2_9PLEO|nr:unnamed protein product [Periconia digitata]